MKAKINFKQILATLGLLTIAPPLVLNVTACGVDPNDSNESDKVIKDINNISDLQIDISRSTIENPSVFDILDDAKNGVAIKISHRKINNFDISLFKLDSANIYNQDKEKIEAKNTPVAINQIYYFQFFYNEKNNQALVPVKIINLNQDVVAAIKNTEYKVSVDINSSVETLTNITNVSFIKRFLSLEIQQIFDNNKLEAKTIRITDDKNNSLRDIDLEIEQKIKGKIIFDYGAIKDVTTTLVITVVDSEQITAVIDATTFNKDIFIHDISTVAALKSQIGSFIKEQLTDEDIKEKFNIYQFVVEKVTLDDKDNAEFKDSDLLEPGNVNTTIHYKYGSNGDQHETKLAINLKIAKITTEKFVEIATSRSESKPFKFTIPIIAESNIKDYLQIVATAMKEQIEKEFQDIEKYYIDSAKLEIKVAEITSESMDPKRISQIWFTEEKTFNAVTSIIYNQLPIENIKIIFEVIKPEAFVVK